MNDTIKKIQTLLDGLSLTLNKCTDKKRGWISAALRARKLTREIEREFKNFRRESIDEQKAQKKVSR